MNLFSRFRECLSRAFCRKKTLIAFAVLAAGCFALGIVFITTPAIYEYHIKLCDRFVDRVCFSDKNVFAIFLERGMGNAVLLLIVCLSGVHIVGCIFPPIILAYRSYTLGGSLYIFFTVYRVSGAFVAVALYLPIHLLIDIVLFCASAQAYARAPHFGFAKRDWGALFADFLCLFAVILAIGLVEMLLLLALFHPLGNIF